MWVPFILEPSRLSVQKTPTPAPHVGQATCRARARRRPWLRFGFFGAGLLEPPPSILSRAVFFTHAIAASQPSRNAE